MQRKVDSMNCKSTYWKLGSNYVNLTKLLQSKMLDWVSLYLIDFTFYISRCILHHSHCPVLSIQEKENYHP